MDDNISIFVQIDNKGIATGIDDGNNQLLREASWVVSVCEVIEGDGNRPVAVRYVGGRWYEVCI
ncbi:MAG: hypothetical protein COA42_16755 [Alteromonadaceae bacterium]|nr:MAG: hypothetical protein COA42_16755 [Alteromonadaceae bacterium]